MMETRPGLLSRRGGTAIAVSKFFFVLVFLALVPAQAAAEQKCYPDPHSIQNRKVCFPLGAISFADRVIHFDHGKRKPHQSVDPRQALGEPDYKNKQKSVRFFSLGCGGVLIVRFTDNALVDGDGPDLHIFEIGEFEYSYLSVSKDGKSWVEIGWVKGDTAAIDLAGKVKRGERYFYVRLEDRERHCSGRWPGADIDAIGAVHTVGVGPEGRIRVMASDKAGVSPAKIALILDASGSMRGKLKSGERKIDAAKRVLRSIVRNLPAGPEVGLRVYGHRWPPRPKSKSCTDTELVVPFGKLDRQRMIGAIDAIRPRGQTPIGLSLARIAEDLGPGKGYKLVVLLSDGIETCAPRKRDRYYPVKVVSDIVSKGVSFRVNIVGFDITRSAARAFLSRVAKVSGGSYFGARDADELERALRKAINVAFVVRRAGVEVARGAVGGAPVTVPAGTYTVVILTEPNIKLMDVEVKGRAETSLTVESGGANPKVTRKTQ